MCIVMCVYVILSIESASNRFFDAYKHTQSRRTHSCIIIPIEVQSEKCIRLTCSPSFSRLNAIHWITCDMRHRGRAKRVGYLLWIGINIIKYIYTMYIHITGQNMSCERGTNRTNAARQRKQRKVRICTIRNADEIWDKWRANNNIRRYTIGIFVSSLLCIRRQNGNTTTAARMEITL